MDLIQLAVPFFIFAMAAELVFGILIGRNTYRLNDAFSSLMLGILSQGRKFIMLGVGGLVYAWAAGATTIPQWDTGTPLAWLAAFVLYDLC
ncbi:MAG: sterol desaturase family protein, partial [Luminiphilus sp.]|nr:sterol desaturase family protein [Luminiphilus sp.]